MIGKKYCSAAWIALWVRTSANVGVHVPLLGSELQGNEQTCADSDTLWVSIDFPEYNEIQRGV